MTTVPEFRIAANDPTLAHVMANGQIKRLRDETQKLVERLQSLQGKTSVRDGAQMLKKHFGKLLLIEDVVRLSGSRPKGRWLALDANVDGGSDMVVVLVGIDRHGWTCRDTLLRLSSHAVARLMQRTTGSSSLDRFAEVLHHHIVSVLPVSASILSGHRITSVSRSGAMIWLPYEGGLRGTTWLAADSMSDEKLAQRCREQEPNQLMLRLDKDNNTPPSKEAAAVLRDFYEQAL